MFFSVMMSQHAQMQEQYLGWNSREHFLAFLYKNAIKMFYVKGRSYGMDTFSWRSSEEISIFCVLDSAIISGLNEAI